MEIEDKISLGSDETSSDESDSSKSQIKKGKDLNHEEEKEAKQE